MEYQDGNAMAQSSQPGPQLSRLAWFYQLRIYFPVLTIDRGKNKKKLKNLLKYSCISFIFLY
jgi:hypothetical protein